MKPATVNTYVAAVKSFLGFAHRVGFTRFNAAPLIKLKKAPRQVAQRILGELEVRKLIDAANPGRDRLMLEVAYFGGLRVSELVSLTWRQVIATRQRRGAARGRRQGRQGAPGPDPCPDRHPPVRQPRRRTGIGARVRVGPKSRAALTDRARQFHRQGRSQARRRQPGGLRALAAACARQPRHRQRRADHARVGDARPRRSQDDVRLCPRPTGRELGPVSQEALRSTPIAGTVSTMLD